MNANDQVPHGNRALEATCATPGESASFHESIPHRGFNGTGTEDGRAGHPPPLGTGREPPALTKLFGDVCLCYHFGFRQTFEWCKAHQLSLWKWPSGAATVTVYRWSALNQVLSGAAIYIRP